MKNRRKLLFHDKNQRKSLIKVALFHTVLVSLFPIHLLFSKSDLNFHITLDSSFLWRTCFNYINNWQSKKENLDIVVNKIEEQHCLTCKFQPDDWAGDSTERDAIVTFCFSYAFPFIPFIRMIRSCKCKAKVIILCDERSYQFIRNDPFYKTLAAKCGLYLINIGYLEVHSRSLLYQLKTYVYRDFLFQYQHLIDRVFMCDLADAVFQSDPFKQFSHNNAAYCYKENYDLSNEEESLKFYEMMNESLPPETLIITPAVYFGKPIEVLKFLDFVQYFYFDRKTGKNLPYTDQSIVNLVAYKKYYTDYDIDMRYIDWNGGIISANTMDITNKVIGNISCRGCKVKPFYIHHPNYVPEMLVELYKKCPRTKKDSNVEYIYGLSIDTMNKLDIYYKEHGYYPNSI